MTEVLREHPLIDTILAEYRGVIGAQWTGYRNHCYFVYNLVRTAVDLDRDREQALAIAVAFHDLGLWTHGTIDYLEPSAALARLYCERADRAALAPLVEALVLEHHRITDRGLADADPLVRAFRDADSSAVTFGLLPFERRTQRWRTIAAAFPDAGFHVYLVNRALGHWMGGGLRRPLPMMRW